MSCQVDENLRLLQAAESALVEAGFFDFPVIFFDASIPKKRQAVLRKMIVAHGGKVVTSPEQVGFR